MKVGDRVVTKPPVTNKSVHGVIVYINHFTGLHYPYQVKLDETGLTLSFGKDELEYESQDEFESPHYFTD